MSALIYLHGFLSSPQSKKAQIFSSWLQKNRPDINYICPQLSPYPEQTKNTLLRIMMQYQDKKPMLIGSSMGGFWASWLVEKYACPAVLINPAVKPSLFMPDYIDTELKNYYSDETYRLSQADLDCLLQIEAKPALHKQHYWLMVQTDDETLDYRLAVEKYNGSKQLVESGGNHSFKNIERHIPDIVAFLEQHYQS